MQPGSVMTYGLGEGPLAPPATLVQETLDPRPVCPLPDAPPQLLGVIDLRDASVPRLDLRRLLAQEPRDDEPDTPFVVLALDRDGTTVRLALRVDRVIEVTALDEASLGPVAGADLLAWDSRLLQGLGRRNGAFVAVLNPEAQFDRKAEALPGAPPRTAMRAAAGAWA